MLLLSPAKLLVILVVALLVLGPDKLPKVAKQIGGFWGDIRRLREKLESEVRDTFPDLPSTDTIHQAVRSPLSFLDGLSGDGASGGASASEVGVVAPPEGVDAVSGHAVPVHRVGSEHVPASHDAELN